jgi:hypothetical protein
MLRMVATKRTGYGHMYSQFPEDYQSTISAVQATFIANPTLTLAQLAQRYPEVAQSDIQATMNAAISGGLAPAQVVPAAVPATTIPLTVAPTPVVSYSPTTGQPIYTYPTTSAPITIFGLSLKTIMVFGALGVGGLVLFKVLKKKNVL